VIGRRRPRWGHGAVALLALLLGAPSLVAPSLRAQGTSREVRPRVLRLPASVAAAAMGDVGAILTGADVLFYNPAMLPQASGVALAGHRIGREATSASVASVQAVGGVQLGLGARLLGGREAVPRFGIGFPPPDSVATTSAALTVGAARAVGPLRVGASASWARDALDQQLTDAAFVDLGITLPFGPSNAMNVAAVVQQLGRRRPDGPGFDQRPWRGVLAFGGRNYPLADFWDLTALTQLVIDADGTTRIGSGAELTWVPVEGVALALRGGYQPVDVEDRFAVGPITAGLGASVDRWTLEWAVDQRRLGAPSQHRIGVRIR
jgi:hypothetical protein